MNAIQLSYQSNNLSFILLTISFCIIGILYAFHYKYSKELILSSFGQRYANQYLRDDNIFKKRVNILFTILMILNISFFVSTVLLQSKVSLASLLMTIFYTSLYYFLKFACIWFLGILLKMKQISYIALFFTNLFDKVFALFAYPLLVLFHFCFTDITEISSMLLLSFLLVFFFLKIYWKLKIGIKSFGLSRFYLFLYICILEFFPLVLVYRGIVFA
ncbi:MAG: hypothetical protein CMD02_03225 [Flavobacteriales bacterium]|nr:hypothetical protein [Flavobacteriales bacterium]